MTQTEHYRSLGFVVSIANVPSGDDWEATFNAVANDPDAARNTAVASAIYRSVLPEVRQDICEAVAEWSGVDRDEDESDETYVRRALATRNVDEITPELTAEILGDRTWSFKVKSPRTSSATPRKGKIGKTLLARAEAMLSHPKGIDNIVARLEELNGLTIARNADGTYNIESLAWAIKANDARIEAENEKALFG